MYQLKPIFQGRLNRTNFSVLYGIAFVMGIISAILNPWLKNPSPDDLIKLNTSVLFYWIIKLYVLIINTKRLHDIGYSGYFALLLSVMNVLSLFIPLPIRGVVAILLYIVIGFLLFKKGAMGTNKYGSLPKDTVLDNLNDKYKIDYYIKRIKLMNIGKIFVIAITFWIIGGFFYSQSTLGDLNCSENFKLCYYHDELLVPSFFNVYFLPFLFVTTILSLLILKRSKKLYKWIFILSSVLLIIFIILAVIGLSKINF